MRLPDLPAYYYLAHFLEMVSFVETTYDGILEKSHRDFIRDFRSLSKDEQCLLVRMINRRGHIFDRRTLSYPEIADLPLALENLMQCGYLRNLEEADYAALLGRLNKDTLIAIAKAANQPGVKTSFAKLKLIAMVLEQIPFSIAVKHAGGDAYVVRAITKPIDFLLYLYFGKTCDGLKSFALRDLGIARVNDAASFKARFSDGEEARACFYYSQVLDGLSIPSAALYHEAAQRLFDGPEGGDYARSLRDRAALEIGTFFEKQKRHDRALDIYRFASSPECNERAVRVLYASGHCQEAEALLERMIDDPGSDEEHNFASDYYARKFGGKRVSACTELLRAGPTITVDEVYRGQPEAGVAGILRRGGFDVYPAENILWHTLFGLLFWDELFESGHLPSAFDWVPHCLKDKSFARLFDAAIAKKLKAIRAGTAPPILLKVIAAHWGRPNGIFSWDLLNVEALHALLSVQNKEAIAAMVQLMALDFWSTRDGFPDLMLAKDGHIRFVEIKAEGDTLRRNQLTRLRQMQTAGFAAEIFRVGYRFDPEQDYVAVDVETTGGAASFDRITEIGAIKIRNHQIIDQWHSLINPQRSIPAKIAELTGVSNEMVRTAPLFAEIADGFMAFMADSIFVAHNVNFDYGFVGREYARLERRFHFPKFCTCAGMRRHYPGHTSYSLGNLCTAHRISLENHHRALCDAKAAGQLLNLINRKREANLSAVETGKSPMAMTGLAVRPRPRPR